MQKKFIVLTYPRTGSNLLVSFLKKNKQIEMYEEIFNFEHIGKNKTKKILVDPLGYLDREIYKAYTDEVKAVGFKIFFNQAKIENLYSNNFPGNPAKTKDKNLSERGTKIENFIKENYDFNDIKNKLEKLWSYLEKDQSIYIVHLKRKNKLKSYLSLKRAFLTDQWVSYKQNSKYEKPIKLDFNDCLNYFKEISKIEKKIEKDYSKHKLISIFYEDLSKDPNSVLTKVQKFLGVENKKLYSNLKKQSSKSLSESIINYKSLKEKFRKTKWNIYFED